MISYKVFSNERHPFVFIMMLKFKKLGNNSDLLKQFQPCFKWLEMWFLIQHSSLSPSFCPPTCPSFTGEVISSFTVTLLDWMWLLGTCVFIHPGVFSLGFDFLSLCLYYTVDVGWWGAILQRWGLLRCLSSLWRPQVRIFEIETVSEKGLCVLKKMQVYLHRSKEMTECPGPCVLNLQEYPAHLSLKGAGRL